METMTSDIDKLINRLVVLSPMPNDLELSDKQLEDYAEIISELAQLVVDQTDVIKPLINSFGYGEGYEIYWSTVHLLEKLDQAQVDKELMTVLEHGAPGPCMWAALMLGRSRNKDAVPLLIERLSDQHELMRANCINALAMIDLDGSIEVIRRMENDDSPEVRRLVAEILKEAS